MMHITICGIKVEMTTIAMQQVRLSIAKLMGNKVAPSCNNSHNYKIRNDGAFSATTHCERFNSLTDHAVIGLIGYVRITMTALLLLPLLVVAVTVAVVVAVAVAVVVLGGRGAGW